MNDNNIHQEHVNIDDDDCASPLTDITSTMTLASSQIVDAVRKIASATKKLTRYQNQQSKKRKNDQHAVSHASISSMPTISRSLSSPPQSTTAIVPAVPTEPFDFTLIPGIRDIFPIICSNLNRQDIQSLYQTNKGLHSLIETQRSELMEKYIKSEPHNVIMSKSFCFTLDHDNSYHDYYTKNITVTGLMIDGVRHGIWSSTQQSQDEPRMVLKYNYGKLESGPNDEWALYTTIIHDTMRWYKNGMRHRENDQPAEIVTYKYHEYVNNRNTSTRTTSNATCSFSSSSPKSTKRQSSSLKTVKPPVMRTVCEMTDMMYLCMIPELTRKKIASDCIEYAYLGQALRFYQNDEFHRDGDKPAVITRTCIKFYKHGKLHRDPIIDPATGEKVIVPAVIYRNMKHLGALFFVKDHKLHSVNDIPASIYPCGTMEWFKEDMLHRDNDLPAIVMANGTREWYQYNKLHRENDMPAIIRADGLEPYWRESMNLRVTYQDPRNILASNTSSNQTSLDQTIANLNRGCVGEIQPRESEKFVRNQYAYRKKLTPISNAEYRSIQQLQKHHNPYINKVDGTQKWYYHGKLHRDPEHDLPAIIYANGTKEWYEHGFLQRKNDRPAIEYADGRCEWRYRNRRHRDHAKPAITWPDGTCIYYSNGRLHRDDNDQPAIEFSHYYKNCCYNMWYNRGSHRKSMLCSKYLKTKVEQSVSSSSSSLDQGTGIENHSIEYTSASSSSSSSLLQVSKPDETIDSTSQIQNVTMPMLSSDLIYDSLPILDSDEYTFDDDHNGYDFNDTFTQLPSKDTNHMRLDESDCYQIDRSESTIEDCYDHDDFF